ncbi:hypothetical protein [Paenibacillus alginolyticus]|uniref:Uncharacterized protein n=1 Tax=Paenibacillus alginolyticus TaxID=59839 RepID=A0ABT4GAL8_9BACL|nr:hypothetical protein [Paenibacillus alginolyticus]MCY9693232.1 hypothetical protein [Paenibacillus alginolyticus]MEC0145999.1 hypothetical protein [Paenibacillus alginolyticus]
MNNCKICVKQQSYDPYFVMEQDSFVIYHAPIEKQLVGYLYVEPKRHVESWGPLYSNKGLFLSALCRIISFNDEVCR